MEVYKGKSKGEEDDEENKLEIITILWKGQEWHNATCDPTPKIATPNI